MQGLAISLLCIISEHFLFQTQAEEAESCENSLELTNDPAVQHPSSIHAMDVQDVLRLTQNIKLGRIEGLGVVTPDPNCMLLLTPNALEISQNMELVWKVSTKLAAQSCRMKGRH